YVGVDESEDVQLFYYFAKSDLNPREDPLVLWLTGGPGCSSFTGFAYEVEQDDDELKIALRSVAASLAIHTGLMAESFIILQWLIDHPEFLSNPFYVAGDSYSGITVPTVAHLISDGKKF
ncbi:hypothetical protein C3L33_10840, partial [Rhododendron williamsianum]